MPSPEQAGTWTITPVGLTSTNHLITFQTGTLTISYASGGTCNGEAGHAILQPINPDGTSISKQGSTVPAKFRVCDANGQSIGTPGVVADFRLTGI